MLNAIKMLAVAVVVATSVSSAFAATHADRGQWVGQSASYSTPTDRNSIVEETGN
jgi:hypothetical protein